MYNINSVGDVFRIFGKGALIGGVEESINQGQKLFDDIQNARGFEPSGRNYYSTDTNPEAFVSARPELREVEGGYRRFLDNLYEEELAINQAYNTSAYADTTIEHHNFQPPTRLESDMSFNEFLRDASPEVYGNYIRTFRDLVPTEVNRTTFLMENGNGETINPISLDINEAPVNYDIKPTFSSSAIKNVSVPQTDIKVPINNPYLSSASTYDLKGDFRVDPTPASIDPRFSIFSPTQQSQNDEQVLARMIEMATEGRWVTDHINTGDNSFIDGEVKIKPKISLKRKTHFTLKDLDDSEVIIAKTRGKRPTKIDSSQSKLPPLNRIRLPVSNNMTFGAK